MSPFERLMPVPGVPPGTVALTFDDGPHPRYTAEVLDRLEAMGAPATFFVVGELAAKHSGLVRRAHAAGMAVGNHTWDHGRSGPFHSLPISEVRAQIVRTNDLLGSLGVPAVLFRPAGRKRQRPEVARVAAELGLRTVMWNVDPADWRVGGTPKRIAAAVLGAVGSGAVVLLHDGGRDRSATVAALPDIVAGIRAAGLELISLDPSRPPTPAGAGRGVLAGSGSGGAPASFPTPHVIPGREGHTVLAVVVHTNVGSFASTVDWFALPESGVSAHYLVGLDGRVARFVDESDAARHAGRVRDPSTRLFEGVNPNLVTVGIEFEDGGEPESVVRPDAQYRAGAGLLREVAGRWGLPLDRGHVIGHREIFSAKSCPGNLDVDRLIREARRPAEQDGGAG